jgi:hypothetical protein
MPSPKDSMMICGSDSDLMVQSLGFPSVENLIVFQNNGDKQDLFCEISRVVELIQMDLYSRQVEDSSSRPPAVTEADRFDYMLLFILNGNDYLPKIRGITFHKILDAYATVFSLSNILAGNAVSFN